MKTTTKTFNRIAGWLLLGLFLLGMLGIALATGWEETLVQIRKISAAQIAILLLLSLTNYFARGLRWHIYTRALGLPTTIAQDFRHYLGGFALTVTPGRVGELIRLNWIARETGTPYNHAAPLALVDRAADLVSVGLLLALTLALSTTGISGGIPVALTAILVALIVTRPKLFHWVVTLGWKIIGRFPRLFATIRRAARRLYVFSNPRVAVPALLLGALGWFAEGLAFHLLLIWLGVDISVWTSVSIFLFAMMAGGATGMPGGLGGAEITMLGLLALQGIPLEITLPATAIIRATTLWFAILIGLGVFPIAERQARRGKDALETN